MTYTELANQNPMNFQLNVSASEMDSQYREKEEENPS